VVFPYAIVRQFQTIGPNSIHPHELAVAVRIHHACCESRHRHV